MNKMTTLIVVAMALAGTPALAQTSSGSPGTNAASGAANTTNPSQQTAPQSGTSGAKTNNSSTPSKAGTSDSLPSAGMGDIDASGGVNDPSVNPRAARPDSIKQ